MMRHPRLVRAALALLVAAALVSASAWGQRQGLPPPPRILPLPEIPSALEDDPAREAAGFSLAIKVPTDANLRRKLEGLDHYLKEESWSDAVRLLQALVEQKEDAFMPVTRRDRDGQPTVHWTGIRREANRLLATLPRPAREFYELTFGPTAGKLLCEAKANHDPLLLEQVAFRFFHTEAGREAAELLGTLSLDRGDHALAALCFQRLLNHAQADELAPLTLVRAAAAFQKNSDSAAVEAVWKRLAAKTPQGIRLGNRHLSLDELQKQLGRLPSSTGARNGEWIVYGGNPSRNGMGTGSPPELDAKWSQPLVFEETTRGWLRHAHDLLETRSRPAIPGFHPIAVGEQLIYRSYRGVHAVGSRTGNELWNTQLTGSLDALAADEAQRAYVSIWNDIYLKAHPHIFFENSLVGSLSSDGSRVYTIEDWATPPFPSPITGMARRGRRDVDPSGAPTYPDAAYHNRLVALDLKNGEPLWVLGGRASGPDTEEREASASLLQNTYFLGPPLPLAGRLYAMTETQQNLRLVCLQAGTGELLWAQTLASPQNPLLLDAGRRLYAAHLAYGRGILVCPTNAGAIFGVDPLTRQLVWAFAYRDKPLATGPRLRGSRSARELEIESLPHLRSSTWKSSAPIIHDGRVIFTAPDAPAVYCLDVRDGALLWKQDRREDDLYLAGVFEGKVLLVGKQDCRALKLTDGAEAWRVEAGLPSGQGAAAGKCYYLPLKSAGPDQEPAIYVINLEDGAITSRLTSPGKEVPGNLLFASGLVLSQSADNLTAYPQAKNP